MTLLHHLNVQRQHLDDVYNTYKRLHTEGREGFGNPDLQEDTEEYWRHVVNCLVTDPPRPTGDHHG